MGYMFRLYRVVFRPSKTTDPILQGSQVHCGIPNAYIVLCKHWICSLRGPEDDSIESKHVAHVSMVVDIPINCCVRLLHLVPILTRVCFVKT